MFEISTDPFDNSISIDLDSYRLHYKNWLPSNVLQLAIENLVTESYLVYEINIKKATATIRYPHPVYSYYRLTRFQRIY